MNKKRLVIIATICVTVITLTGVFFATNPKNSNLFLKDTTIKGDFTLPAGEEITLKNGSTLTVTGNATLEGEISCDGGPLSLIAEGDLRISGSLHCNSSNDQDHVPHHIGLQIVAAHVIFEKSALIETDGHVIIVNDAAKIPRSDEALGKLYNETAESSLDDAAAVGPFIDKKQITNNVSFPGENITDSRTTFKDEENGDTPSSLTLAGTWNIDTSDIPTTEMSKLFLVNMGANSDISLNDITITGGDGQHGANNLQHTCTAKGEDGGNGFHLNIHGGHLLIDNGTIELGSGGDGGDATSDPSCDKGEVTGGNGGKPGNMKITAAESIAINALHINGGSGGNGGSAIAISNAEKKIEATCPAKNGQGMSAIGGNGGDNKKDLIVHGAVTGIQHIQISRVIGGNGGNAIAKAGNGNDSVSCECGGGTGGSSSATGGKGGDATVSIPMSTGEARGGDGGNVESYGGSGGSGFGCTPPLPGMNGGNGVVTKGQAGKGTTANGNPGLIKNNIGGNGGNGGNGCPVSLGGAGGTGNPPGTSGKNGVCATDIKTETIKTSASKALIKAILYKGKYLPLDQIIITNEPGCGEEHWRAERGSVVATDGTIVPDADVVCGFGKISENKPTLTTPEVTTIDVNNFASTTKLFKSTQ